MALTNEVGLPQLTADNVSWVGSTPAFGTTLVIDAGTELIGLIGFVWHPTVKTGTIAIRKVHFRCGAVTLNVASTVRVSLQDVSATTGPPYQPDGTQDQTADMTSLTANGWNTTGNLSADRTVDLSVYGPGTANSRLLAVVFEYQAFNASDSVVVSHLSIVGGANYGYSLIGGTGVLNTGSWALVSGVMPIVVLECDDGSFAFLEGCSVFSALGSATTANNATFRAIGVKFRVPTQRKVDRAGMMMTIQNGCDGDLILYDSDGTTALVTVPIDNDAVSASGSTRYAMAAFEPVTLSANTYYRFVFVPSTTTTATVFYGDVNAAGIMDGAVLGQDAHYTTRDSGGSWTDTTTRRPHFALGFSAYHDGAGGGGGLKLAGRGGLAG